MAKRTFIKNTLILILTGFVVRILGFVYRVYLSNLIGAEGIGLFGLILPVYSLIILTLTSGISIGVSKMVAFESAKGNLANIRRIIVCAAAVVLSVGVIVSGFVFAYADFITNAILKDSRTYYSLLLLIPCIPIIAAASVLKGYFYGTQDIVPTAASQLTEQIVRIVFVMIAAGMFINLGLEYACAVATLGMALGEIANLLVLLLIYRWKKIRSETSVISSNAASKRTILKELLFIALPISFNRFITSTISTAETLLIPARLLAGGMAKGASISEFGRMTGMAMPVLFFPSLITSSLATMLVPSISEAASVNNFKAANHKISKSVQLTLVLGVTFMAVFFCYPNQIGKLIYKKAEIGDILFNLSFACIFLYLQQTLLGILNGLGKQAVSLRNSIIGYVIRIGFVYFCIPVYGLLGYIWGMITSSIVLCILNLYAVIKTIKIKPDIVNWLFKPGFIGAFLIINNRFVYSFVEIFKMGTSGTTISIMAANMLIAFGLAVVTGIIKKGEVIRLIGIRK